MLWNLCEHLRLGRMPCTSVACALSEGRNSIKNALRKVLEAFRKSEWIIAIWWRVASVTHIGHAHKSRYVLWLDVGAELNQSAILTIHEKLILLLGYEKSVKQRCWKVSALEIMYLKKDNARFVRWSGLFIIHSFVIN